MQRTFVFATGNTHKVEEARAALDDTFRLLTPADIGLGALILPETADTLEGNAQMKACTLYDLAERDCFAEDTGLEVIALSGKPGVYSARFAGDDASTADNMQKLLLAMQDMQDRSARFRAVIALVTGNALYLFEGIMDGTIATEPRGTQGFGYDPVFIPRGYQQTLAELGPEVKAAISHRALAVHKLADFVRKLP